MKERVAQFVRIAAWVDNLRHPPPGKKLSFSEAKVGALLTDENIPIVAAILTVAHAVGSAPNNYPSTAKDD